VGTDPSQRGSEIGVIDCPDCGPDRRGRILIRDDSGRPAMVVCLGCEQFFPAERVAWREKGQR
jgi:hypothetical protein